MGIEVYSGAHGTEVMLNPSNFVIAGGERVYLIASDYALCRQLKTFRIGRKYETAGLEITRNSGRLRILYRGRRLVANPAVYTTDAGLPGHRGQRFRADGHGSGSGSYADADGFFGVSSRLQAPLVVIDGVSDDGGSSRGGIKRRRDVALASSEASVAAMSARRRPQPPESGSGGRSVAALTQQAGMGFSQPGSISEAVLPGQPLHGRARGMSLSRRPRGRSLSMRAVEVPLELARETSWTMAEQMALADMRNRCRRYLYTRPAPLSTVAVDEAVDEAVAGHIIVCGLVPGLHDFMTSLRASSLGGIVPVVFLVDHDIGDAEWRLVRMFHSVYFVTGSRLKVCVCLMSFFSRAPVRVAATG